MCNSVTGAKIDSDRRYVVTGDAQLLTTPVFKLAYSATQHLVQVGAWHNQHA